MTLSQVKAARRKIINDPRWKHKRIGASKAAARVIRKQTAAVKK